MKIKNWSQFQHFKDRRPPWIKLYRDILDDIEWHELDAKSAKVLVMLWLIASLVFLLLRVAPGDPIDALLGTRAPREAREALRQQLGLDQPLLSQYSHYLNDLLHGQLGQSLANQEQVSTVIGRSLPASLELGVCALLVAALLGLAVGFSGIARPEGRVDLAGRLFGIGTYALPPFWAAMLLQLVFAVWLGWLPVGGRFPATLQPPDRKSTRLNSSHT